MAWEMGAPGFTQALVVNPEMPRRGRMQKQAGTPPRQVPWGHGASLGSVRWVCSPVTATLRVEGSEGARKGGQVGQARAEA